MVFYESINYNKSSKYFSFKIDKKARLQILLTTLYPLIN
jgi:hypothetical protein